MKLFVKIDTNGNGSLCLEEFENAFQDFQDKLTLKKRFNKEDVQNLFKAIDANNNGVIDYSGINNLWSNFTEYFRIHSHIC